MELLVTALVIALLVYALERNHHRHPAPRLTGSTDIPDRDADRLTTDLLASRTFPSRESYVPVARVVRSRTSRPLRRESPAHQRGMHCRVQT
ncbi:hypothetical protein [Actinophytocola gossypii]|uniref:Uncharacterized protein n=1 Tax=Actinophytocola gossypii TaxID=2812003 RepID=A0ABT2J4J9_9PSEU|nr:hypothetical protein [Actinophytocola gossypii]MCT2582786.1 hypothetical protein [Actinophytocola gossypii]